MTWTWDSPTTRRPEVVLAVFSAGPLTAGPLSLQRHGVPGAAALTSIQVREVSRSTDPAWFDGWRSGSLRRIAASQLPDLGPLDQADTVHLVIAGPTAPADLSYLQAAWGVVRWIAERGGTVVLDAHAQRFALADTLPPPDSRLEVSREIQLIFETDSRRDDLAHALHTRGLRKFGAPDLVALCHAEDADIVGTVLAELAGRVASGLDLSLPRHRLDVAPGERWWVVGDEDGLTDVLALNNPARVVLGGDGRHLVGTAARWAARFQAE